MPYIRTTIFQIDQILPLVGKVHFASIGNFHFIKLGSWRYRVYAQKGTTCVTCGLKANYFALERDNKQKAMPHLNLYALVNGKEIMMTIDHIIPKSKGGSNDMENLQPMCSNCNEKKGDRIL
ncbi:MAG: HNH endonuclease [Candidatus Pacearchaeota archaeon]